MQQSIEKMLKSILAYDNKQIKKTHNLKTLSSRYEIKSVLDFTGSLLRKVYNIYEIDVDDLKYRLL